MTNNKNLLPPSPWVIRFMPLITDGSAVLDLACGRGRHAVFLADAGYNVTAVDRDLSSLPAQDRINLVEADLEDGSPWPLAGRDFDGIVVTNYLHRPLFPVLIDSLRPGGVLIYETFAVGNEAFGRPTNPDFLLRDGELFAAVAGELSVVAYEAGKVDLPKTAVIQRIAAVKSPDGPVPLNRQVAGE